MLLPTTAMRGLVVALIPHSPRCWAPVKRRSHGRGSAGGGKERGTGPIRLLDRSGLSSRERRGRLEQFAPFRRTDRSGAKRLFLLELLTRTKSIRWPPLAVD